MNRPKNISTHSTLNNAESGTIARIEVELEDINRFQDLKARKMVIKRLKRLGFTYITLDLQEYRSGSMNEALEKIPLNPPL